MDFDFRDLGSSDWQKRRQAVERLLQNSTPAALKELLRVLRERQEDLSLLNAAIQVLQHNALPVMADLVELLQDEDTDTRIYAAQALGQFNHVLAIPPLVKALEDPDPNVRYHAIDSLGQLRAVQAVPALRSLLNPPDFFLTFPALHALARIGDTSVAPDILPLLDDPVLGGAAAEALGELGAPGDVPALLAWMDSPQGDLLQGCAALARLAERFASQEDWIADKVQRNLSPALKERLLAAVGQASAAQLPSLVTVLGWLDDEQVYRVLLTLLERPEARPSVERTLVARGASALPALLKALPAFDGEALRTLVGVLGAIGDERALPLLTSLLSSSDISLVVEVVAALGKIGAPQSLDDLLELLRHPSGLVRRAAVAAVNSLGHPRHTERLLPLCTHPDPRVRAAAVESLAYFADHRAVPCILQSVDDEAEIVQLAAVKALGVLKIGRTLDVFGRAVRSPHASVRAAAMQSLALVEWEAARPLLDAGLHDEDDWVRLHACRALGVRKIPAESIVPLLASLAQSDPALHVRLTAIEALGQVGGSLAWDALLSLLDDNSPEIVEAALQGLSLAYTPEKMLPLPSALFRDAPEKRQAFVRRLGTSVSPGAVFLLRSVAEQDPNFEVRTAALEMLAALPLPDVPRALVVLLERSPDVLRTQNVCLRYGLACLDFILERLPESRSLRRRAVPVLQGWASQSPRSLNALLNLSRDPDAGIRKAAAAALFVQTHPSAYQRLREMQREDPNPEVRLAIQDLLENQA